MRQVLPFPLGAGARVLRRSVFVSGMCSRPSEKGRALYRIRPALTMARPLHPKAFLAWRRRWGRPGAGAAPRPAPPRRHLADALAEDLRGFLEHGGCAKGIVVCTAPGLRQLAGKPPFTAADVWAALEEGEADVTPGLV